MSINPYSGHFSASLPALNNRHRLKQLRQFIGLDTMNDRHSLDIGGSNYISEQMLVEHNTRGDLNNGVIAPGSDYDAVTCLEVLNHVQQDLTLLRGIHALLKPNGKLYLSTPKLGLIAIVHGAGNYKELKQQNTIKILEYCGFKVVRIKTYRSYPMLFMLYGFLQPLRWFFPFQGDTIHAKGKAPKASWRYFGMRPVIKWLFHKYILIEAVKE